MTKAIPLSRPATSAIAAFLALSAPQAFAQATPADVPTMVSPVAVPEPSAPAPVAAPQAAPQVAEPPAPKPVIRVPIDLPAEPAEPVAKAAERPAATAKAAPPRAERSAASTRSAEPAAAAEQTVVPAAAALASNGALPLAPTETAAPVEPASTTAPPPVSEAPAQAAAPRDAFPWELAGGAAALLLVGGAGLAFARRRRANHDADDAAMSFEEMAAAEAVPYDRPRTEIAPQPAMRSTPSFAAAPHGSMGRHEAMALAGPTPENPFETLKKRLQRARFLDRQERVQYEATLGAQKDLQRKPVSAWEVAQREISPPAQQEVRRPERGNARPGTLRPGLIRH
ncbi:hypothetical protein [Sphingopyxis sp. R3-92]|uniref:hypothetical protein n=1 Tax=Sphingopyxis sp. R3-92 TaxID=3158553 RepID=UPI003EE63F11